MDRLPDLAFGNVSSALLSCPDKATQAMSKFIPSLSYIESSRSVEFLTKIAAARIGTVGLIASSVLPSQMEVSDSKGWHLVVPYFGSAAIKFDRKALSLSGGQNAILLPNIQRKTDNSARSAVFVSLDIARLNDTIATIRGFDNHASELEEKPHELDLRGIREMFPAFQRICAMIDSVLSNPHFAELLGIEDVLYRWTAFALRHPVNENDLVPVPDRLDHRLDVICDLIHSTHERTITLTEMERISGLSARGLQYAFKARFGCSPMEWQRRERIHVARNRLISARPGETITEIAHAMGYASSAAFASQYKRFFEETPSQTLRARS